MKTKTKLIASIMSICLVCAVFAIGVFALKTANLKIGGDVSFSATGVEADIENVTLTGATNNDQVLATGSINTSMTQADIDTKFQSWQTLELDFDENATDIELKFVIANTSTNPDNYIEIDYSYTFSNSSPNVDVFSGDENDQKVWENNNYILAPKGSAETATYETFTLKFKVLDKELNVPQDTKVSVNIALKHTEPVDAANAGWTFTTDSPKTGEAKITAFSGTLPEDKVLVFPAVIKSGGNNFITRSVMSSTIPGMGMIGAEVSELIFPNSITNIGAVLLGPNSAITSLGFPVSLTNISGFVAYQCRTLTSVFIPNSITSIEQQAFSDTGLTSITIPTTVKTIGSGAFERTAITSITIPSSVTSLRGNAFWSCNNLTSAKFENPTGWFVADSADATSGTPVTVTSDFTEANAIVLKGDYNYLLRKDA